MVISNGGDNVTEVGCFNFKLGWASGFENIDKEKE